LNGEVDGWQGCASSWRGSRSLHPSVQSRQGAARSAAIERDQRGGQFTRELRHTPGRLGDETTQLWMLATAVYQHVRQQ
jgi:hypothetical protein